MWREDGQVRQAVAVGAAVCGGTVGGASWQALEEAGGWRTWPCHAGRGKVRKWGWAGGRGREKGSVEGRWMPQGDCYKERLGKVVQQHQVTAGWCDLLNFL